MHVLEAEWLKCIRKNQIRIWKGVFVTKKKSLQPKAALLNVEEIFLNGWSIPPLKKTATFQFLSPPQSSKYSIIQ